jgi:hypothetical protein
MRDAKTLQLTPIRSQVRRGSDLRSRYHFDNDIVVVRR